MSPFSSFRYVPLVATTLSPEAEEISVSTISATAAATGHLMFKIENYSRLKARHGGNSSFIDSGEFNVGGHTWKIRCYLNGDTKENAGFVSLFLHLCSDDSIVQAEYEFALVRHLLGTPPAYGHQAKPSTMSHGTRSIDIFHYCGWGYGRFISVEELERSTFLREDCFAVRCKVTVIREQTVKEKVVQPVDMARMGMLCKCDDERCKHRHARPAARTFLERFANFFYSVCRGGPVRITHQI